MLRVVIMTTLAIAVAGCSAAPARHDTRAAETVVTMGNAPPAAAAADESPKKPKLSCVQ